MPVFGDYCDLDTAKDALGITDSSEDTELRRKIRRASRAIDALTRGRRFVPRHETRTYDHPQTNNAPLGQREFSVLVLDDDLLAVNTLTTENGSTTIQSSDQILRAGRSTNMTPYDRIELKLDGDQNVYLFSGTTQESNSVDGVWGYHPDWDNAWLDSLDTVQDNPLSSSATTLTVNDIDGADVYGQSPRISPGMLLRIDSEYLYVAKTNVGNETATVVRGVNGTTAASHTQGTTIEVYQVPLAIQEACIDVLDVWRGMAGSQGIKSEKIGGEYDVTYVDGVPVPEHVTEIVKAYREVRL